MRYETVTVINNDYSDYKCTNDNDDQWRNGRRRNL